jgi:predicted RNase H-like HicB family nuclease
MTQGFAMGGSFDQARAWIPGHHLCCASRAKANILWQSVDSTEASDMARAKPSASESGTRTFIAVIEPDEEEGGYVVTFPAIPDLATQGETIEEARLMAEDCLRGYLELLREAGRPMPAPRAAMPSAHATMIELQIPAG